MVRAWLRSVWSLRNWVAVGGVPRFSSQTACFSIESAPMKLAGTILDSSFDVMSGFVTIRVCQSERHAWLGFAAWPDQFGTQAESLAFQKQ